MSWGVALGRNPLHIPWSQFLDEAASAGYSGIELGTWGYLPTAPERLGAELSARDLALAGAQLNADFAFGDDWPTVIARTRAACDLVRRNGADRLVLLSTYKLDSSTPDAHPTYGDYALWSAMIERIQEVSRVAMGRGVLPVYHPHAGGGIETEDEIERFLADTDPGLVSLCFDTGHHAYGGGDAVRFVLDHADRIAHVHLKNVNATVLEQVRRDGLTFSQAGRMGVMTELELGMLDLARVHEALVQIGYDGWAVVEQDRSPDTTAAPSTVATRNRQFLRRISFR